MLISTDIYPMLSSASPSLLLLQTLYVTSSPSHLSPFLLSYLPSESSPFMIKRHAINSFYLVKADDDLESGKNDVDQSASFVFLYFLLAVPHNNSCYEQQRCHNDSQLESDLLFCRAFFAGLNLFVISVTANSTDWTFVARHTRIIEGFYAAYARPAKQQCFNSTALVE